MAVTLKRSAGIHLPQECVYGCCTTIYGKNVPKVRRTAKRRDAAAFRRSLRRGDV